MFEIDIIALNEAAGPLEFIGVKRALGHLEGEELHLINLKAAALAARRVFEHGDYQTNDSRLVTIRWLPPDKAAPGNVLIRETVDVGLKAPSAKRSIMPLPSSGPNSIDQ